MSRKITNENEFRALMEEVDQELRDQNVPITGRSLRAFGIIRRLLEITGEIRLFGPSVQPTLGCYEGNDLTNRVFQWFNDRYGKKQNFPLLAQTMVVIRGDPYKVELPYVFGTVGLCCDPSHLGMSKGTQIGTSAPPIINALDLIDDLSANLAQSLKDDELSDIGADVEIGIRYAGYFLKLNKADEALVHQANNDLASSVDDFFRAPPDFGGSRWHSLQAAEKFLKALLTRRAIAYPKGNRGHDIKELARLASAYVQIEPVYLDDVMCNASVRYNEAPSTLQQAHNAHRSAILICEKIIRCLP